MITYIYTYVIILMAFNRKMGNLNAKVYTADISEW